MVVTSLASRRPRTQLFTATGQARGEVPDGHRLLRMDTAWRFLGIELHTWSHYAETPLGGPCELHPFGYR